MLLPEKFALVKRYYDSNNLQTGLKVLDVGGSVGVINFVQYIFSTEEVYILNNNFNHIEGYKNFIIGDAARMPTKNAYWDLVSSFDCIEHLFSPDDFLEESYRVLKPGGLLILTTPNLADIYSRIMFILGYMPYFYTPSKYRVGTPFTKLDSYMDHRSVFTFKGLEQLLRIHKFQIVRSDGYSYTDIFYYQKQDLGLYSVRKIINCLIPKTMREGMLFICKKSKESACS